MNTPPALPSDLPPSRRQKRGVGWVVVIGAVLAVCTAAIVPGFYLEERIRGQTAWRRYEADAKARGVKLNFTDFIPPRIPDKENFASIPIFDAVFHASDNGQEIPNPFELPKPPRGVLPNFADPIKEEPVDLTAWQKYFVTIKLVPTASDDPAADVLKALDHYSAPLAQLHEAVQRPHCRFPVHWERGYATPLPHLGVLQCVAKLYALRLSAHLAIGDSAAAYDDFQEQIRLTKAIRDEPSMVSGLVRLSTIVIMDNAIWNGLSAHQWAESDLRKIEADLATMDWLKDYIFAIGSERAANNLMIEMIRKDPRLVKKNLNQVDPSGWFDQNKVRMNRFFDELPTRIDLSHRRFHGETTLPSSPSNIKSPFGKIYYIFFIMLSGSLEGAEVPFIRAATLTDQARLACALERFRLGHGEFPQSLAELAPEFIPQVPVEIVNGEPYHYRITDDGGFVLYSVGMDLRDDGGVIGSKLRAKRRDWVWRYPAK